MYFILYLSTLKLSYEIDEIMAGNSDGSKHSGIISARQIRMERSGFRWLHL